MKKRVIISGGGTLGHILPIIPVIIDIYEKYDLYFIGTKKGMEKSYFQNNDYNKCFKQLYFLDMEGINRKNVFKNINVFYKYYVIRKKLKNIYKNLKPDLVIGMGGYISGVAINIANRNNIKTIIHEQNAVMGLANKLVYKKVNKVLLSYDILNINNKILVGNPRYSFIKENYKSKEKNEILIVGGSLGSDFINNLIIDNIENLDLYDNKIKLVTGKRYYNNNKEKINKTIINHKTISIYPFLNNLIEEMSKATLIISRSGATTISEIIGLSKPAILIPSPNVTGNHQYKNAVDLYSKKCCLLIEEKDLSIDKLNESIRLIITNYSYKKQMMHNLDNYYQNNPKIDFIKIIEEELC